MEAEQQPDPNLPEAAQEARGARIGNIPLRAVPANAITVLALCMGLTGVRFAMGGVWENALLCIVAAGILDGMDGRIARALKGNTRFGAELDSLSDVTAFGVAPALTIFLWSLHEAPKFGWVASIALAVCCALRLARFNARIDVEDQPHKSAGFNTGVPAPAGAGLALMPMFAWLVSGNDGFRQWYVMMPWMLLIAFLMISNIATFSWGSIRLRRSVRLEAIAVIGLIGVALITAPWYTLLAICMAYLATIPFSIMSYAKVKRARITPA